MTEQNAKPPTPAKTSNMTKRKIGDDHDDTENIMCCCMLQEIQMVNPNEYERIEYMADSGPHRGVIDTAVVHRVDRSPRHAVPSPTETRPRTIPTPPPPPPGGLRGEGGYRGEQQQDEQSMIPAEYLVEERSRDMGGLRGAVVAAAGVGSVVQGIARSLTRPNKTSDWILRVTNTDPWDRRAIPETGEIPGWNGGDDFMPKEKRSPGRPRKSKRKLL